MAHIGDSTSEYLWEAQYVGGPANTMGERYRSVGVERWVQDSSGGRSTVERVADWQTNAVEAAVAIRNSGFAGCWVVMVGTNDAANVAAGSQVGHQERVLRMLDVFGADPVLWLDAATIRSTTAYAMRHMETWNEALRSIAAERPNVSVLAWSERVRPEWFVADGTHMSPEGRAWRAAITSAGLVAAFPP